MVEGRTDLFLRSLELPWRDNARNISCIPAGTYRCTWHKSPRFGWTYWVRNVPDRSGILFHAGNWAGDTSHGYRTHSWGCILLGRRRGMLKGQQAVLASRLAVRDFYDACERAPEIELVILEDPPLTKE